MTTPPRPTRADYEAALNRIHQRRRAAGDDHPLALSEDPRDVLTYLRRRGRNGLVVDVTGDDVTDALTLKLWLWWEAEAAELWLLEAAEALGRNRRTVGATLGLTHGQSLVDRIKRKREMFGREQTAAEVPDSPAATAHDVDIRSIAAGLIDHLAEMPTRIAEDLYAEEVADALTRWPVGAPVPSEGVMNAVRFLLGDLDRVVADGAPLRTVVDIGKALVGARYSPQDPGVDETE